MFDIFAFNSRNSGIKEESSFTVTKLISENLVQKILTQGTCQSFKLPFQYGTKLIIDAIHTFRNIEEIKILKLFILTF